MAEIEDMLYICIYRYCKSSSMHLTGRKIFVSPFLSFGPTRAFYTTSYIFNQTHSYRHKCTSQRKWNSKTTLDKIMRWCETITENSLYIPLIVARNVIAKRNLAILPEEKRRQVRESDEGFFIRIVVVIDVDDVVGFSFLGDVCISAVESTSWAASGVCNEVSSRRRGREVSSRRWW